MRLSRLIDALHPAAVNGPGDRDPEVTSIHCRSRDVRPGGLFVAMRGMAADGHVFIRDALGRGAVAVVSEKPFPESEGAAVITVPGSRRALAQLSSRFYGDPSAALAVVGVTGTNGKTTTTYLIESILEQAGYRTGVIGTINTRYGGMSAASPVTTPESLDLQRILAEMHAAGIRHVVLEASSHAIALDRIHGCWMDVAVFTNLSQDHLDFHGDMQAYWQVKKRLFTEHLAAGPKAQRATAVINTDHPHGRLLAGELQSRVISVGTQPGNSVAGSGFNCDLNGIRGFIELTGQRFEVFSPLVGRHNVENILCAAGAALALDVPAGAIRSGIEALRCVPGRLERVFDAGGRFVYVDYSHTPDALENALAALRALVTGRIICVFGCGGDRDRAKRPLMGEIAARLSDLAVVTSDNPRSEKPLAVIAEILPGLHGAGGAEVPAREVPGSPDRRGFVVEANRRQAIELAIRAARPGDMVLIAGKGHETYQIIGEDVIHFDDREEARRVIAELGARSSKLNDGAASQVDRLKAEARLKAEG